MSEEEFLRLFTEILDVVSSSDKPVRGSNEELDLDRYFLSSLITDYGSELYEFVDLAGVTGISGRYMVIDGSSRRYYASNFKLFIGGVAVYGSLFEPLGTYPHLLGKALNLNAEFLALKAPEEVLSRIEDKRSSGVLRHVKVRSDITGNYFSSLENESLINDELRTNLENKAVEFVGRSLSAGDVLIIDGPLYMGIGLYMRSVDPRGFDGRRIEALNQLSSNGVLTLGVVKRVEFSRKLCNKEVLDRLDPSVGVDECMDINLISRFARKLNVKSGEALLIGPFELRPMGVKGMVNYMLPARVFWYVYTTFGSRIFRIEVLKDVYERSGKGILNVIRGLVMSIDRRGLPYLVDIADRHAKELTDKLRLLFHSLALSHNVIPTYDTLSELLSEGGWSL